MENKPHEIAGIDRLFVAPTWQVFALLLLPGFFSRSTTLGLILTILWVCIFVFYIYRLGDLLYNRLPEGHGMNLQLFHFNLLLSFAYLMIILLVFDTGYTINQGIYQRFGWGVYLVIPLHFYLMFAIFYIFLFIAKSISIIGNGKNAKPGKYIGYIFLLWFYPIGIWWMHPMVRHIMLSDDETLALNHQ